MSHKAAIIQVVCSIDKVTRGTVVLMVILEIKHSWRLRASLIKTSPSQTKKESKEVAPRETVKMQVTISFPRLAREKASMLAPWVQPERLMHEAVVSAVASSTMMLITNETTKIWVSTITLCCPARTL